MRMQRLLPVAVAPLVGVLAACGGHADLDHPTGHDDVVIRVESSPGMGTRESFFSSIPEVVLTGDGTAYVAMQEATMTGIVSPVVRFTAPDGALDSLLSRADQDHLLADPPDYAPAEPVLDGGSTTVVVTTHGGSWTHTANGLSGDAMHESTDRARLADFVGYVTRWSHQVQADDAEQDYAPALRVIATPLPETADLNGPVVPWPAVAHERPADLGSCTVVDDPAVVRSLTSREERFYRQDGTTYSVAAAVLLPGDSCSDGGGS